MEAIPQLTFLLPSRLQTCVQLISEANYAWELPTCLACLPRDKKSAASLVLGLVTFYCIAYYGCNSLVSSVDCRPFPMNL